MLYSFRLRWKHVVLLCVIMLLIIYAILIYVILLQVCCNTLGYIVNMLYYSVL